MNNVENIQVFATTGLDDRKKKFLENAIKVMRTKGIGDISDGYHTYNELYDHRAALFACLCSMMPDNSWKSLSHSDPDFPMFDGMFIVGIETPYGQISYHYDIDPWWDIFEKTKTVDVPPKYDGHTPDTVVNILTKMARD